MYQIKPLLAVLFVLSLSLDSFGQRKPKKIEDSEDSYKTFTSFGITTNTNSGIIGGGVFRQSSAIDRKFKGNNQYRYLAVELVNVKHHKEISQQVFVTGARLTYGKQNYLFVLRPEYGREITLFSRHEDEGIAISAIFAAGPSIGFEKPYMIQYQGTDGRVTTKPFDPNSTEGIVGAGSFFAGFGLMKVIPGLHAKAALSFELSAFRDNVTGIEVGLLTEGFTRKPEIMAVAENKQFFTSGFITLYFGTKKR